MNGFAILMFIFGGCTFLVGLYMLTGHKLRILAWKAAFKGLDKEGWKKVGKGTKEERRMAGLIFFTHSARGRMEVVLENVAIFIR